MNSAFLTGFEEMLMQMKDILNRKDYMANSYKARLFLPNIQNID